MARYCGMIGFATSVETAPGVWEKQIVERKYYGDKYRNTRRLQSTNQLNDDIVVNNEISIVADPYAYENFHSILYAEFMGVKWKASNVDVQRPRLVLTLGGVYNGN